MYSQNHIRFIEVQELPMTALLRRLFFRRPAQPAAPALPVRPITELDLLRALGCDE
jgi:hypothetical protein